VIVVGGFNSAIDKCADTDRVEPGAVLRLRNVRASAGGKGLHVALACATLGEATTLVGLIDHSHRGLFEGVLSRAGVAFAGVIVDDSIRTCFAIRDADGRTTELLEPGPTVPDGTAATLMDRFITEARNADMAVLSGSLPAGLGVDSYARLIRAADRTRVLVDASGDVLAASLNAAPLLVKPNRDEAAQLVGFSVDTWEAASRAAAWIAGRGPTIVVVSLGAEGAFMHTADDGFRVRAPVLDVRNAVGAGDCLLGGFAVGLIRRWSFEECARFAVACGSAKVRHSETGILRAADVQELLPSIRVERTSEPPR
jgi:1-phosphofructokinase family hexose kinase